MGRKKSPNLARSEVIYVLTKKDNNIAKNGESRPINIIIIINYYLLLLLLLLLR